MATSELEAEEGIPLSQAPDWYRPHPWYGWKTLLVDATSLALIGASVAGAHGAFGTVGLGGYVLVSPLIHVGHGEGFNALGSFGLRIGLPVVGGLIGAQVNIPCRDWFCVDNIAYGVLIGMGAAVVLDAAFLGYRRGDDSAAASPAIVPAIGLSRRGGTLGLAGTF